MNWINGWQEFILCVSKCGKLMYTCKISIFTNYPPKKGGHKLLFVSIRQTKSIKFKTELFPALLLFEILRSLSMSSTHNFRECFAFEEVGWFLQKCRRNQIGFKLLENLILWSSGKTSIITSRSFKKWFVLKCVPQPPPPKFTFKNCFHIHIFLAFLSVFSYYHIHIFHISMCLGSSRNWTIPNFSRVVLSDNGMIRQTKMHYIWYKTVQNNATQYNTYK